MMNIMVWSFFDELVEHPDMKPFFKNIAMVAMKTHTVKLFKIMFGTSEEQPEEEDLLEYLLRTHTRLFRDLGLDETHFDTLAGCFVQGLQSFQVDQALIDECVAVMGPLRVVFEYGAKLAKREKELSPDQLQALPIASANTIGTDAMVALPVISTIVIPDWLPKALGKDATMETVREWSCELTDRFGAEGDCEIADTYLDQPYMDHHIYNVAFLQLAFLPSDTDRAYRQKLVDILLHPRGRDCARLSRRLFDRMVVQFALTCAKLGMPAHLSKPAEERLRTCRSAFASKTVRVNGATRPHFLSKKVQKELAEQARSKKDKKTKSNRRKRNGSKRKQPKRKSFTKLLNDDDDDDDDTETTHSVNSDLASSSTSTNPIRRTLSKTRIPGYNVIRKVVFASRGAKSQ